MSEHDLFFGNLDLIGDISVPWKIETLSEGADWGSPQAVTSVVQSLLQDGSLVVKERDENRTVTLRIAISGGDTSVLAAGEAALVAETGRRNTLTWTPPDGIGEPTVFDVLTSELRNEVDDVAEVFEMTWYYVLTLTCSPYPRAVTETVAAPLEDPTTTPPTPSTVVIDNGSSATAWSTSSKPVVSAGSYLYMHDETSGNEFRRVGSVPFASTPYLSVDFRFFGMTTTTYDVALFADDVFIQPISVVGAGDYLRKTWKMPPSTVGKLHFQFTWTFNGTQAPEASPGDREFRLTNLTRSNVSPLSGTSMQRLRQIPVGGSARTEGSLEITHASSSLGDVLAYTWRDDGSGYVPALRTRKIAGDAATVDSSLVSGARDSIASLWVAEVPISQVPAGVGQIVARVRSNTAGSFFLYWRASTRVNGVEVGFVTNFKYVTFPVANVWQFVTLGRDTFRSTAVKQQSAATVRFSLQRDAAVSATIELDDMYYLNIDPDIGVGGAWTLVSCGTAAPSSGGSSSRLSIETASVDRPHPSIYRGTLASQADWFYAGNDQIMAWGAHEFLPGIMNLFVVTSNASMASSVLRHYERFHTHVS